MSKGVAAALALLMWGYLGWELFDLVRAWFKLWEEAAEASTFAELREAGDRFGKVIGPNSVRILLLLGTAAVGETAALVSKAPKLPGFANSSGGEMEPMSLEVLLELVSGDIVGMKRHQDVLRTLLSSPAGEWRELRELDAKNALAAECQNYSPDVGPRVLDGLRLAWTPHPDEPSDSPYCLILFFYDRDGLIWHSVAIFNRDTL